MHQRAVSFLFLEPAKEGVDGDVAIGLVDRFCERDGHRADLDAVLGIAAVSDSVLAEEAIQTLVHIHFTGRVHIE